MCEAARSRHTDANGGSALVVMRLRDALLERPTGLKAVFLPLDFYFVGASLFWFRL